MVENLRSSSGSKAQQTANGDAAINADLATMCAKQHQAQRLDCLSKIIDERGGNKSSTKTIKGLLLVYRRDAGNPLEHRRRLNCLTRLNLPTLEEILSSLIAFD
jgi:hypothetical protein